jgi:hypothetical protein
MRNIAECLSYIGVTAEDFTDCSTLDEEFKKIKQIYFKNVLRNHPDKG